MLLADSLRYNRLAPFRERIEQGISSLGELEAEIQSLPDPTRRDGIPKASELIDEIDKDLEEMMKEYEKQNFDIN